MSELIKLLTILLSLSACSSYGSGTWARDYAERFVDADTNQPIEGVYANIVWTKSFPGKVGSECVQATLVRSGADGWARFPAPKDREALRRPAYRLAPGYKMMYYKPLRPNDESYSVVLNRIEAFRIAPAYPAWIASIEAMGYRMENEHYVKEFTLQKHPDPKVEAATVRLITRRSFLPGMRSATLGVSGGCEDKSRNVGLLPTHAKHAAWLHRRENVKTLCDERWDTARSAAPFLLNSVFTFINPEPINRFSIEFPDRSKDSFRLQTPFSKAERIKFCSWIGEFVPELSDLPNQNKKEL